MSQGLSREKWIDLIWGVLVPTFSLWYVLAFFQMAMLFIMVDDMTTFMSSLYWGEILMPWVLFFGSGTALVALIYLIFEDLDRVRFHSALRWTYVGLGMIGWSLAILVFGSYIEMWLRTGQFSSVPLLVSGPIWVGGKYLKRLVWK